MKCSAGLCEKRPEVATPAGPLCRDHADQYAAEMNDGEATPSN